MLGQRSRTRASRRVAEARHGPSGRAGRSRRSQKRAARGHGPVRRRCGQTLKRQVHRNCPDARQNNRISCSQRVDRALRGRDTSDATKTLRVSVTRGSAEGGAGEGRCGSPKGGAPRRRRHRPTSRTTPRRSRRFRTTRPRPRSANRGSGAVRHRPITWGVVYAAVGTLTPLPDGTHRGRLRETTLVRAGCARPAIF